MAEEQKKNKTIEKVNIRLRRIEKKIEKVTSLIEYGLRPPTEEETKEFLRQIDEEIKRGTK